ncbi:MAG TPA: AAA family ATPase, partial [bacterium]|nr:AAA family ATPase [bacterium]
MSYLVIARKWRPQTFEDVVGQSHVTRTLQNAITAGRVAHAYLFTGPRGVGKTTTARILAKALNCEKGPTPHPCLVCPACVEIAGPGSVDV